MSNFLATQAKMRGEGKRQIIHCALGKSTQILLRIYCISVWPLVLQGGESANQDIFSAIEKLPTLTASMRPGATERLEEKLVSSVKERLEKDVDDEYMELARRMSDAPLLFTGSRANEWKRLTAHALEVIKGSQEKKVKEKYQKACAEYTDRGGEVTEAICRSVLQTFAESIPLFNPRDPVSTLMATFVEKLGDDLPEISMLGVPSLAEEMALLTQKLLEELWPHLQKGDQTALPAFMVAGEVIRFMKMAAAGEGVGVKDDKDAKKLQQLVQQHSACKALLDNEMGGRRQTKRPEEWTAAALKLLMQAEGIIELALSEHEAVLQGAFQKSCAALSGIRLGLKGCKSWRADMDESNWDGLVKRASETLLHEKTNLSKEMNSQFKSLLQACL